MFNPIRRTFAALLALGAIAAAPALAKNVEADTKQIAELLQGAGYKAEIKDPDTSPYINSATGGYNFAVYLYGCDKGKNCKSVQFYAGFTPKTKLTAQQINDYTRENRWGRTYLDKDGDPAIEMDVDLEKGGMSEALFLDNLAYFEAVLGKFATFVFEERKETKES